MPDAWLHLALAPGVGNTSLIRLLTAFGSPEAVLASGRSALSAHLSKAQCDALLAASGVMVAAIGREMHPGLMAYEAAGVAGVAGVLFAGWTTANPTLYRAGLALQTVTPGWPRWKITFVAGAATTVLACFPVFFLKLLDYVAIYGLVLMTVGAIVFAEHWLFPLLRIEQYRAEKRGWTFNLTALVVWLGTLAVVFVMPLHLYFRWLPGRAIALASYTALMASRRPK